MTRGILSTAFIFLFCGTMTTLLIRSVFIPEESRLAAVASNIPFDLFLSRTEGSDLDIWEGNQIAGRARFAPLNGGLTPAERRDGVKVRIEILIRLKQPVMGAGLVELLGDGMLHASGTVDRLSLRLTLHGTDPLLQLALEQAPGVEWPALKLTRGGSVIFASAAGEASSPGNEMALLMLQSAGLSAGVLNAKKQDAPPARFRQGRIEAGGESFVGYLLSSGSSEESMFRLYMANTGEILRITTPLGLEMLAESLRPAGAVKPNLERYPAPSAP